MSVSGISSSESVSEWLVQAREGNADALQKLWSRYFKRLTRYASARIPNALQAKRDGEDCAIEAFQSMLAGIREGRLDGINSRDELWILLTVIAGRRVASHIEEESRDKRRSGESLRLEAMAFGSNSVVDDEDGPALLVELEETIQRLFDLLSGQHVHQIARMRLSGHLVAEIAEILKISPRTVQRKLSLIRRIWLESQPDREPN